jgi:prepilin-type N-terminal cleavage/methylation domain-containing protein
MLKSEKGVTLIELLAALALLSLILLLASSLHLFGQKQTKNQATEIQGQSNVTLAMNVITKEIRSAQNVSALNNVLTITKIDNSKDEYKLESYTLKKNNQPLISDIKEFTLVPSADNITITISSNTNPQTTLKTTIYYRK